MYSASPNFGGRDGWRLYIEREVVSGKGGGVK
jgi:hypothetical protein